MFFFLTSKAVALMLLDFCMVLTGRRTVSRVLLFCNYVFMLALFLLEF